MGVPVVQMWPKLILKYIYVCMYIEVSEGLSGLWIPGLYSKKGLLYFPTPP